MMESKFKYLFLMVGEERMKTISFRANEEVQDYIKLLCDEEVKNNSRPSKTLSDLINKIILEHRDKIHGGTQR